MESELVPLEGRDYVARPVSGLVSHPIGSSGKLEFGYIATVEGFGDRLWFVVATHDPGDNDGLTVRFNPNMYFSHSTKPQGGSTYDDARFYVVS